MLHYVNKDKFFSAIFAFLSETIEPKKAEAQTNIMIDNINETISIICTMIENHTEDFRSLSQKFHTLKNLLLYGDFYYESDLCQDIEVILRKKKNLNDILSSYEELIECLKNI